MSATNGQRILKLQSLLRLNRDTLFMAYGALRVSHSNEKILSTIEGVLYPPETDVKVDAGEKLPKGDADGLPY